MTLAYILVFVAAELLTGFETLGAVTITTLDIILTLILAGIAGGAFFTGIVALIKNRESATTVFLATGIGFYGFVGSVISLFRGL